MNRSIRPAHRLVALSAAALLTLAACGNGADKPAADSTTAAEQHDDGHDHEGEHTDEGTSAGTEAAAQTPRLAITYDGGIAVLDANTLETEGEFKLDGFNRVNSAGDGRHVAVTTTGVDGAFTVTLPGTAIAAIAPSFRLATTLIGAVPAGAVAGAAKVARTIA